MILISIIISLLLGAVKAQYQVFCCDTAGCWTYDHLYYFYGNNQPSYYSPDFVNVFEYNTRRASGKMFVHGGGSCSYQAYY